MQERKKPFVYMNSLLARSEFRNRQFREFLAPDAQASLVDGTTELLGESALYIKTPREHRPRWAALVDAIAGRKIDAISNRSSSAVLLLRSATHVHAFTFGYGRFLLNLSLFEPDFGLRTALNTLDHQSLRSVDLHTLEDQPIQKKAQAARGSQASVFGIDIYRDVLRAVTGSPRSGVNLKNICGGDAIFSFGTELSVDDIPLVAKSLAAFYELDLYKGSFSWVDNIRKVKDLDTIRRLDERLLQKVKENHQALTITLPEIVPWDSVLGFSYTRSKTDLSPTIESEKYLGSLDPRTVTIEALKRDQLFVTDVHGNIFNHSIYSCLYLELGAGDTRSILFGGKWYELNATFEREINAVLDAISVSDIAFPEVERWESGGEKKIETEGDYNTRVATALGFHLLDKKLVKCSKTTTPIELCDLLTPRKQLVHVKHKKGGSAGLSHLFAQGNVSAEVMLGDRNFRKAARQVAGKVHPLARDLVPLDGLKGSDYEIVFLILGEETAMVKHSLPFFSKVNLTRAFENLTQRGFQVRIGGAAIQERP